MSKPDYENEVALNAVKPALKSPHMAEMKIRRAIEALPQEEREAAGGVRSVKTLDRETGSHEFRVNKDFLAQLVLDCVIETHGVGADKHVSALIAEAGLASKCPQGRH